jgi:hypothetical protein
MIPLILFLSAMIAYGSKHWIIGTVILFGLFVAIL